MQLPLEPKDVEAFVNDSSPDTWANLVDRLLESLRYGERWGRHWPDVARYADTAALIPTPSLPSRLISPRKPEA